MRIKDLQNVVAKQISIDGLEFSASRGEKIQINVLENDIVRVQMLPDGDYRLNRTWTVVDADGDMPREGRSRADITRFSRPKIDPEQIDGGFSIDTVALQLHINIDPIFHLRWSTSAGEVFAEDMPNRAYPYDVTGDNIYHYLRRNRSEHYYGFGEKAGELDKNGYRLEMKNLDALGYSARTSDPLYKHFPFYITFNPELNIAYGLFYDNLAASVFDMGREIDAFWGEYRYYEARGGDIDYYMIMGPTIAEVIEKFTWLTGRPFMPPRYSLGYLGSTMSYTEAPNAQEQLKEFAEQLHEHDIPCDGFHLSSGYTTDANGNRLVFTWNRDRVPDPAQMVQDFHDAGIRVMPNIKPWLLKAHPDYDTVDKQGGFMKSADADETEVGIFWSGGAYENAEGSYFDFTSAAGYGWWQQKLHGQLFAYGMDAMWNDNNEFGVWDDAVRCDGFGENIPIGLVRPLQTLLMAHASFMATKEAYPDKRPFLISRSSTVGVQRYAQTWSGDNSTSWETLRYNIPMGLGMGLSGAPSVGHDVGGFFGPKPDPELFLRWVQNGVMHPRFTIHSWNSDGTPNEPWMHPSVTPMIRDAIQFRYRLMPYFYSLFWEAHQTGHPIIRPMVYHYADDPKTHTESFDFMLGPNLLVASVIEPLARTREVYLPKDTQWLHLQTATWYDGGQTVTLDAPLDAMPLLIPAGGMIPLGGVPDANGEVARGRILEICPPYAGHTSTFTLYEDDGESNKFEQGDYATIQFTLEATPETVAIHVDADVSRFQPDYDQITITLPRKDARLVEVVGAEVVGRVPMIDMAGTVQSISIPGSVTIKF